MASMSGRAKDAYAYLHLKLERWWLIARTLVWFFRHHHGQFAPSAWNLTMTCSSAKARIESRENALTVHWLLASASNAQFDVNAWKER